MKNKLMILMGILGLSILNAIEHLGTVYEPMSAEHKDFLKRQDYREILNPHSDTYEMSLSQLLRNADMLSGRSTMREGGRVVRPTLTAEDQQIARNIYDFVLSSPQDTITFPTIHWATEGLEHLNSRTRTLN